MEEENVKQEIQSRLISVSAIILIGKFIAYYITDSVGILTDAAVKTIVNVITGTISLFFLKAAVLPIDTAPPSRSWKNGSDLRIH